MANGPTAKVLVTGAAGFIGRALAPALRAEGYDVVSPGRDAIGDIGPRTDWSRALEGVNAVVHLAGLAHARHGEAALMRVNAEGAGALAAQAAGAGVGRFILLSSVKAVAETSARPLVEADAPTPGSAYGRSKLEAERAVLALTALSPIALRPPLVHGPDARANFALLLHLAASYTPLPFAGLSNRRSFIARDSLVAAVLAILARVDGPPGTFFVADRPALSAGEIITHLRQGLGQPPNLFDAPALAVLAPRVLRESLEVDDSVFRAAYGFTGKPSGAALAATASAWNMLRA